MHKTQVIWVSTYDIQQGDIIGIQRFVRAEQGTLSAAAQCCEPTASTLRGLSSADETTPGNRDISESDSHLGTWHSLLL